MMEGNIYNNISKEINFKLPDINFDSDSDNFNDDQPIKPYIRPSAEILFGTDDSDSEEILNILSKLPQQSDVEEITNTDSDCMSKNEVDQMLKCELPFINIKLPNGIMDHIEYSKGFDDNQSNNIKLSMFGMRDDIDLDKVLEEMDLSSYQTTFFEDVLTHNEEVKDNEINNENINNDLLKHLDEISKKYECLSVNTNNNNSQPSSTKRNNAFSLANLFDQLKDETRIQTVFLDLRNENQLCSQLSEDLNEKISKYVETIDSDSSEEDDVKVAGIVDGLWIGNYRRSKMAKYKNNELCKTIIEQNDKNNNIIIDTIKEEVILEESIQITDETNDKAINTINEEKDSISDYVRIKIEKIKLQEKILSDRRHLVDQFKQYSDLSELNPLLLNEEISFDNLSSLHLKLEVNLLNDERYFNAFIPISSPNNIITISKIPSSFSAENNKENFIVLLSIILSSTNNDSSCHLPFFVIALHQIYYQNQLQLALLCRSNKSITKIRSDLRSMTLGDIVDSNDVWHNKLSSLPLSNIFKIQPYDLVLNDNIWQWNNASIVWHKISNNNDLINDNNKRSRPFNISTSCVVLEKDFYLSSNFRSLLLVLLDRFIICGLRYLYNENADPQLVLGIRGFDAINIVKTIINTTPFKDKVKCTRFSENSNKELCKYFGPRIDEERINSSMDKYLLKDIVNELSYGISLYSSLYWTKSSDVMLLVSPMCLDIGWILNILQVNGGYLLINVARLNLSVSIGRQFGISEKSIDYFEKKNGVCHLLIIRNENPFHSLRFNLNECLKFMDNQDKADNSYERFFHYSPYSDALVNILDIQRANQTPEIRELICNVPDAPYEDCEQCSFVLIISDEFTRHIAQILDQITNLDLLAVKCFTNEIDTDHMNLIKSQFQLHLPNKDDHSTDGMSELKMRIGMIVVRSMYVFRELEKIHNSIKIEKNLVFAYTITTDTTFRMIGSFFTSSELISDPRRRTSLQFLPDSVISKLNQQSILTQFPASYESIKTALVIRLTNPEAVLLKFRKIWFLLTRDEFRIEKTVLDENRKLHFILSRPNAIFYLIQWVNYHFTNDTNIEIVTKPDNLSTFLDQFPSNINDPSILSLKRDKGNNDLVFVMLNCTLLDSSVEMMAITKLFWNFLEENKYYCVGLSAVNVDGSIIFKLRNISLLNLIGNQLQKETQYLCLLIVNRSGSLVTGDLIKLKFQLLKCNDQLAENIYLNNDSEQIVQCCNTLLHCVISSDNINLAIKLN